MELNTDPMWMTRDLERISVEHMDAGHVFNSLDKVRRSTSWRKAWEPTLAVEWELRMTNYPATLKAHPVVPYLWRCWGRDWLKSDPLIRGWRDTREIANAFQWSLGKTRRALNDALEEGLVEVRDGSPQCWFAADTPDFRGFKTRWAIKTGEVGELSPNCPSPVGVS